MLRLECLVFLCVYKSSGSCLTGCILIPESFLVMFKNQREDIFIPSEMDVVLDRKSEQAFQERKREIKRGSSPFAVFLMHRKKSVS